MANRMSREFQRLHDQLIELGADIKAESKRMLNREGGRVIAQAKRLTRVNTGYLRNSWFKNPVKENGDSIEVLVGNSAEYASFWEFGFRSHFVPGKWEGNNFVYIPGFPGGMYVGNGGFVRGDYMLKKSTANSERRMYRDLNRRIEQLGREMR